MPLDATMVVMRMKPGSIMENPLAAPSLLVLCCCSHGGEVAAHLTARKEELLVVCHSPHKGYTGCEATLPAHHPLAARHAAHALPAG
ncbi:hypothetical protein Dimus_026872, partial [Dionaea muscipula]